MSVLWKRNICFCICLIFGYLMVKVGSQRRNYENSPHSKYHDHMASATYDHHDYKHEHKYPYQPYGFGYEVEDGWGNFQYRHEKSAEPWKVKGSYGYKDAWGIYRHVDYVADKHGFRAHIKTNEPGTAPKDPAAVKMSAHPVPAGHGHKKHHHGYKEEVHTDHSKTSYIYAKPDRKHDQQG
ncbi:uncharacterized protein LOC141853955 [Brevipalpus obovatus]|uniref:uncharacterized protein LOC141853955 n=1 Tax=Brevipalpus obovatus TaxID=246614 RepID=UPI003D9F7F38